MKQKLFIFLASLSISALFLWGAVISLRDTDTAFNLYRTAWRARLPEVFCNQSHFRGRKIEYQDNDLVVLLVGDSFVESSGTPLEEQPERLLEKFLEPYFPQRKVRVFSLGTEGYGQDQEYLALRQYFRHHRADIVLNWLVPGNDIWNNLFPTHFNARKPTFIAEADSLHFPLWQKFTRLPPEKLDHEWMQRYYSEAPAYVPQTAPQKINESLQSDLERRGLLKEDFSIEKTHLDIYLTPRSPRMQAALHLARILLNHMAEITEKHKARFFTFSTNMQHLPDGFFRVGPYYYQVSEAALSANIRDFGLGDARDLGNFRTSVNPWALSPQDPHFNSKANEDIMRQLAERISPLLHDAK